MNKIIVDNNVLTGNFYYKSYINSKNNKTSKLYIGFKLPNVYINYIIVKLQTKCSHVLLSYLGYNLFDITQSIEFNKINPLRYRNKYDNETNKLLDYMVNNDTNLLFIPFKILGCEDFNYHFKEYIQLQLYDYCDNVEIFVKTEQDKPNIDIKYILDQL